MRFLIIIAQMVKKRSSTSAHISGHDDKLVKVAPLLEITGGKWEDFFMRCDT